MALPFHKLLQTLNSGSSIGSAAVAILASYGTDAHIYLPGAAVPVLGPELVTNGDFSAGSTGWSVAGAWTIGSGKLTGVGTGSPTHADHTASYNSIVPGREYLVTFDVVNITGSSPPTFSLRGGAGATFPANTGPVSFRYIAGTSVYGYGARFSMTPVGTSLEIDNLSVKEILSYTDTLNGYTVGNWLESTGNTRATVDNPVGLVLDAGTAVGAEIHTDPLFADGVVWKLWQPTAGSTTITGGLMRVNSTDGSYAAAEQLAAPTITAGKTYAFTVVITAVTAGSATVSVGLTAGPVMSSPGTYTGIVVASGTSKPELKRTAGVTDFTASMFSVKEVPGIHASQGTTANKPILRKPSNNYYWEFDGVNDSLALTSAPFQQEDDRFIVAGFRAESAATLRAMVSVTSASGVPIVSFLGLNSSNQLLAYYRDNAATLVTQTGAVATGIDAVASSRVVAGTRVLRLNGVQQGSSNSTVLGASTISAAALSVVPTAAPGSYFPGFRYPTILVKGTVSDDNLLILERWVGSLTGPTGVTI